MAALLETAFAERTPMSVPTVLGSRLQLKIKSQLTVSFASLQVELGFCHSCLRHPRFSALSSCSLIEGVEQQKYAVLATEPRRYEALRRTRNLRVTEAPLMIKSLRYSAAKIYPLSYTPAEHVITRFARMKSAGSNRFLRR
jgi:hypothetical protein